MKNLGLAAIFCYLGFWICINLIYLITGLSNHPRIPCLFLVDEEAFANCMHGMQRLLYRHLSSLTGKTAQDFIAPSLSSVVSGFENVANFFLIAHMNNE